MAVQGKEAGGGDLLARAKQIHLSLVRTCGSYVKQGYLVVGLET
jgi:hypothetical protein